MLGHPARRRAAAAGGPSPLPRSRLPGKRNAMATSPPTGSTPQTAADASIKVVSHSMLFYWWPVWLLGFILGGLTWAERNRLAVVPEGTTISSVSQGDSGDRF